MFQCRHLHVHEILDASVLIAFICHTVDLEEYTMQASLFRSCCEGRFLCESDAVRGNVESLEPELLGVRHGLQEMRRQRGLATRK